MSRPAKTVGEVCQRLDVSPGDVVERLLTAGVRQFEHEGQTIAAADVWQYIDRPGHHGDVTGELVIVPNTLGSRAVAARVRTNESLSSPSLNARRARESSQTQLRWAGMRQEPSDER